MRVAVVALKVERRSRRSHLSHLSCLERESESQQAQVSKIPGSRLKIRTPRVPQAYLLKTVLAARARDTFHAFQGWGGPVKTSDRPHVATHIESEFPIRWARNCVSRILKNRENEKTKLGINYQKWIVFLQPQTHSFFGTRENNVKYSFPTEKRRVLKS